MRITRLELRRFGHFEDAALQFGADGSGVHVVYGPNEAGKTTTLDAIRYTLHGMPQGRSSEPKYDFRFKTGQIRTAMELLLDSGDALAFARSRSTKASVHDFVTDEADAQLDAQLARALAGVPRAVWDSKHGLDQAAMRRGARALLDNAATDESLFAAATGTASVHRVLDELRAARRALLSDAGSAGELHQAVKELKDATAELARARRAAAGYDDVVAEQQKLDAQVEELNAERHRAEQRRDQLERVLDAAPRLVTRAALAAQVAEYDDLPAGWGPAEHEQLTATLTQLRELDAQLATLDANREQLRSRLDLLQVDETLVAAAPTLDQLHQRLGAVREASERLPELRVEARQARNAARAALEDVQPGCAEDADAAAALPSVAARAQLAGALDRVEELLREEASARKALDAAITARDDARAELARVAGTDLDADALDAAIEVASGIDAAAVEADAGRLRNEWAALEQRARRIPGATLDVNGACCVGVPGEHERRALETAFTALDEREADARDRLALAERHAADNRNELNELRSLRGVPTAEELERLRAERAAAFVPLRDALLGRAPVADAAPSIGTYEDRVRQADGYADTLAADGERAGRARELQRRIDADEARAASARADLEQVAVERDVLERRWKELWAPTAIAAASIETMRVVLDELAAIRDAADALRHRDGELAARRSRVEAAANDLRLALGRASEEPRESLDALLQQARANRRQLEQARRGAARAQGELEAAERAVAEQQRRLDEVEGARRAFQTTWVGALEQAALDGDTTPAAARAHLDALETLQQALVEAQRASGAEADATALLEAFDADVRTLVASLGPDAGVSDDTPAAMAVESLRARVLDAQADAKLRAAATEQLHQLDRAAEAARASHAGVSVTLQSLIARAGTDTSAALSALDARWQRARQLRLELQEIDSDIVSATRMGIRDLATLLGERDEAELRALLDAARETEERVGVEYSQAKARRDEVQKQVGALEEGDTRSAATARIRDARSRLEQLVPEYRQLALQERMLQSMLDEHARRDMGPVVDRTGRYLATLTCNAWTRMVVGIADDGSPQVQLERAGAPDELVPLDGLSEGTVDQLYLALRLAMLVEGAGRGESMPFILDDVLPSFDDERAEATFRLLGEVSEHFQVVFLTHHAHLAQLAEATLAPGAVTLHELPRFGTPACAAR